MAVLSRRKLAAQAASRIAKGESQALVLREIAAYLIDSGRRKEAELIARDIETELIPHGIIVGTVVSARELSNEAKSTVDSFVKQHYKNVSRVMLRERVDASLIGGVRIELPDKQLDTTVLGKLDKLMA